MADQLSRIQDSLNQLSIQMYTCLRYIDSKHPAAPIHGQPFLSGPDPSAPPNPTTTANTPTATDAPQQSDDHTGQPSPEAFKADLQELAEDLVLKEQHIEQLVRTLPGVDMTQEMQERRIRELQGQLDEMEVEVKEARAERDELVTRVEESLMGIKRV
ncbi:MAG: RNA polymerase II mediator complex subunit [Chrysothrix sp. TS-e1954]|nr:MAG: RNA polymerase II mediator complex subunit [Chrysothrix sp. TS-e1954]